MNPELNPPSPDEETTTQSEDQLAEKPNTRLRSLDALRGFDMFWIVGGEVLVHRLARHTEWPWLQWLGEELHHVSWEGFHFYDLIFPLFLFLAGVALPYSIGRKMEAGIPKWKLSLSILKRVALLILLGIIYNGGLALKPLAETRICSVLGLIGIGYGCAAFIFLYTNPRHRIRTLSATALGILLGYWAALSWIAVPEVGAGIFTPHGNLAGYLDRELLPWRLNDGFFDPEGLLPSFAATATALMGVITGHFLRNVALKKLYKAATMLATGLLILGISHFWSMQLPIIKKMWTPSFMFHCAGWSLIFLSIFYFIIDVIACWRWSFFFIVIGMNPILIYLANRMIPLEHTSGFLFNGIIHQFFDKPSHAWLSALAYIITWWLALLYLHRKKCYLRV